MAEQQAPLLKVSVMHFRDESKDEETWTKWYIEEQIPRFIAVSHKHGIDRCEVVSFQYHLSIPSVPDWTEQNLTNSSPQTVFHAFVFQSYVSSRLRSTQRWMC